MDTIISRFLCGFVAMNGIRCSIVYFKECLSYEYWMTLPECGHLITSCYNVVLYILSARQCLTFLRFRSDPIPAAAYKELAIGFVNNNHFIYVNVNAQAAIIVNHVQQCLTSLFVIHVGLPCAESSNPTHYDILA